MLKTEKFIYIFAHLMILFNFGYYFIKITFKKLHIHCDAIY